MNSLRLIAIPLFIISGMFLGVGFEHMGPELGGYVFCFVTGGILMMPACFAFVEGRND